jgi:hypothetical protein
MKLLKSDSSEETDTKQTKFDQNRLRGYGCGPVDFGCASTLRADTWSTLEFQIDWGMTVGEAANGTEETPTRIQHFVNGEHIRGGDSQLKMAYVGIQEVEFQGWAADGHKMWWNGVQLVE